MKLDRIIPLICALQIASKNKFIDTKTWTWKYRYIIWNTDNNSIPTVAYRTKRLAREQLVKLKAKVPTARFVLLKIEDVL